MAGMVHGPTVGGSAPQKTTGSALRPKVKSKAKAKKPKPAKAKLSPMDDPSALTAPLTPRLLNQQVAAQTDLYAGPAEAEIAGQRAVQQQQMRDLPAWFSDYRAAIADAGRRTQAAYGAAMGMQQNVANSTSALDAQQRASQQASMAADAAVRGTNVDPAVDAKAQQAAASRRQAVDTQTARTAGAGAVESEYRANQGVVAAGQQLTALQAEARRGRNIDDAAGKLAVKKGEFATATRQKLIDAEHTKQLERKAFGLDVAKAQADAAADSQKIALDAQAAKDKKALDRAKLTNDAARIKIAQRNSDISQQRADAYVQSQTGAKGKVRKPTATERRVTGNARNDIEYARRQIAALRTHRVPVKVAELDSSGKPTGRMVNKIGKDGKPVLEDAKLSGEQIRNALLNGDGPLRPVNNDAINAALKLLEPGGGYLSAAQISGLRRAYPGIRIQVLGYQTENGRKRQRVKLAPVNPTGGPANK